MRACYLFSADQLRHCCFNECKDLDHAVGLTSLNIGRLDDWLGGKRGPGRQKKPFSKALPLNPIKQRSDGDVTTGIQ